MSVREYVGARYVPIVVGEWDNTRTYEPLMVVIHEGNSYTSRQYVPAGIDIANESYWILSANYNAQVDAYRKEVQAFDGRITANATAIDAEKTRAEGAERANATAIDAEKTRAKGAERANATAIDAETTRAKGAEQTLKTSIDANTNNIADLQAKDSIIWCGDSWLDTRAYGGTVCKDVANALNLTNINVSWGAQGWVYQTTRNFVNQLTAQLDLMTDTELKHVKYIVGFGGINDVTNNASISDIINAIKQFVNTAQSKCPNARVYICPLQLPGHRYNFINRAIADYQQLHDSIQKMNETFVCFDCASWFIPYSSQGVWFGADTLHLTDFGRLMFKKNLISVLSGNTPHIMAKTEIIPAANCKLANPFMTNVDNLCFLSINEFKYTGTINRGQQIRIGKVVEGDKLGSIENLPYYDLLIAPPTTSRTAVLTSTGLLTGWVWSSNGSIFFKSSWDGPLTDPDCYVGTDCWPVVRYQQTMPSDS